MQDDIGGLHRPSGRVVPLEEAVGLCLEHDITEITADGYKGRAFRRGHRICKMDVERLRDMGKNTVHVLSIGQDEMHEDDAAALLAGALCGRGVEAEGAPREGKVNIVASRDGLLRINRDALGVINLPGQVICATLHDGTMVKAGRTVAGTRAIPLVIKRAFVDEAVRAAETARASGPGVVEVHGIRAPRAGVVITGSEVYHGRIKDAFSDVIREKVAELGGEVIGVHYAPDDEAVIEATLRQLIALGADLLVVTGGMSVDPDDVTRFAIGRLGAKDIAYGAAALPGSMVMVAYLEPAGTKAAIPVIGVPACGIHHKTTVLDLLLPRILAGERVGRRELGELGHGGLCLGCTQCNYPVCPFGK